MDALWHPSDAGLWCRNARRPQPHAPQAGRHTAAVPAKSMAMTGEDAGDNRSGAAQVNSVERAMMFALPTKFGGIKHGVRASCSDRFSAHSAFTIRRKQTTHDM